MPRIAIIGTGVAGLGCAWHLRHHAELTLFDKEPRPGGHTNTVEAPEGRIPIDTGFIVFNKVTYPNLCSLFAELGIEAQPSEMSFSVSHEASGIEYNGMGLNKVFAQRRNLTSPRFLKLLASIFRFFRAAHKALEAVDEAMTLGEFVQREQLGQDFLDLYLVPMSSAVWSTDPHKILEFPASTLLRFFHNHGFLGVTTHHPWFTVPGGARTYLQKILNEVGAPRLAAPVTGVKKSDIGVNVRCADGQSHNFDLVVMACHADQSLAALEQPTDDQCRLLGAFQYQKNSAQLHTWPGVMPKTRRAWASWNYRVGSQPRATTHYWMNALQNLPTRTNYFLSLNSGIPAEHVVYATTYEHPVFTRAATAAQAHLHRLNEGSRDQRIFFCGSYFKYGFHEDAYTSGLSLAKILRKR